MRGKGQKKRTGSFRKKTDVGTRKYNLQAAAILELSRQIDAEISKFMEDTLNMEKEEAQKQKMKHWRKITLSVVFVMINHLFIL